MTENRVSQATLSIRVASGRATSTAGSSYTLELGDPLEFSALRGRELDARMRSHMTPASIDDQERVR